MTPLASLVLSFIFLASPVHANVLVSDAFTYPDGLITNEWAFYNPNDARAVKNPVWDVTSGSLFASGGQGWSGAPDNLAPDATSSAGNNSAVLRFVTKRADMRDVIVSFTLTHMGFSSTSTTPPVDWDGVHVFLRYQDENNLYALTVNRRDGKVLIKKKIGGVYYQLGSYAAYVIPPGVPQKIRVEALDKPDASVGFKITIDGVDRFTAADAAVGGPVFGAGRAGLRGDNSNFKLDDFLAQDTTVVVAPPPPPPPPSDTTPPAIRITAPADGSRVFGSVRLAADASDNVGVAGVTFAVDGVTVGAEDTTAPYEVYWQTPSDHGWHTVTATARDAAGNRGGANARVRVQR